MIIYEYRLIRVLGDENLAKKLQEYSDNGYEPVSITWVGDMDVSKTPGGIVHPSQPDSLVVSKFILLMRKENEVPMGDLSLD